MTVYSFEPDTRLVEAARRMVAEAHPQLRDRWHIMNRLISNANGTGWFRSDQAAANGPGEGGKLVFDPRPGDAQIEISILDSILPDQAVDALKIDAEGFDWTVIQGAFRLLAC